MHRLLTLFALFIPLAFIAQPVITPDWLGQPGDMFATATSEVIPDVSAKGADVTWDFTGIVEEDSTRFPGLFVVADTTPFFSDFPQANQCVFTEVFDPEVGQLRGYQYFQATDDEWRLLGIKVASSLGNLGTTYSEPAVFLEFPMEYEDAFSNFYAGEIDLGIVSSQFDGLAIVDADAYGTVMLPNGTFDNCMRIERSVAASDSTDLGLGIIEITKSQSLTYTWFSPDHPGPLAVYETSEFYNIAVVDPLPPDTSQTFYDTTFTWDPTAAVASAEVVDNEAFAFSINPNPVTDAVQLNFDLEYPGEMTFELHALNGQRVASHKFNGMKGSNQETIDLGSLSSGTYLAVLRGDRKIATKQLIKVE